MNSEELRARQGPLKERYREEPGAARITLRARGELGEEKIACKVETGRARHKTDFAGGLHRFEEHFRIAHRVTVLLPVVGHREAGVPVRSWNLDVLDHQPHLGFVLDRKTEAGFELPGHPQDVKNCRHDDALISSLP